MTPDWLLLRHYAKENSQEAFAALTTRYLNLVYSVCLREVHDPDLAQDVTQTVFLLLARAAPTFRSKTALPGWLFRTARFAAQNARTREQRRRHYEEKAAQAMQHQDTEAGDAAWTEIEPLLNESLAALREGERQCVLLRYFQGLSFAETGAALGLSEEAARKRVTRSLEKMRRFFSKEGIIVQGVALAILLSAHATEAAPGTCTASIATITAGVLAKHPPLSLTSSHVYQLSEGVLKAMKIIQVKVAAGLATVVLLGAPTAYAIERAIAPKTAPTAAANVAHKNAAILNAAEQYVAQSGPAALKAYQIVENIQDESSITGHLSDEQMAVLSTYVDNSNMLVRLQVLAALRHAGSKQAQTASDIARKGFASQDSMTRTYALTTLDRLNVSDIVPVSKKMLFDHSQYVTTEARRILKKRGINEQH